MKVLRWVNTCKSYLYVTYMYNENAIILCEVPANQDFVTNESVKVNWYYTESLNEYAILNSKKILKH